MSYKKYYIYKEQISYDNGVTWQDTGNETSSGDPIGKYDTLEECESGGQYRWVDMDASVDYYCVGTTKYYKQKRQVSFDDGQTWQDVTPPRYQRGDVAETESTDCGYVPPTGDKLVKTYGLSACEKFVNECNGEPYLTPSEVKIGCDYNYMTTAVIGNCVTQISEEAFFSMPIRSVTIPDSVQWIGRIAFGTCHSLTSVEIPNSVTFIGEGAFSRCLNLRSINIPDGVTSLEATFSQDYALTRVNSDVDGVCNIPDGVETIGSETFYECSGLTSINIPNSVTTIGGSAFRDCISLTSLVIPNSVTTIGGGAFLGCDSLTSVTIPNNITTIGDDVFGSCTGLTIITIPNSVITIGKWAFNACTSLTNLIIPNSVTTIGDGAFGSCTGLTNVSIGNNVTIIGNSAFRACRNLTNITIPNSVITIGEEAFHYCGGLTSITCLATTPPALGDYAFDATNDCPIYVPAESVDAYKSIGIWRSKYADRIQPIS